MISLLDRFNPFSIKTSIYFISKCEKVDYNIRFWFDVIAAGEMD